MHEVMTIEKDNPLSRSWTYSEEIAEQICTRLSLGESMRQICESKGMPDRTTVLRWMDKSEEFAAKCARARDEQADLMDDRILEVAEQVLRGEMEPDAARVGISALQWRASKLKPKKYGDSTTIKGDKDNPLTIQALATALDDRMRTRIGHGDDDENV